jgi:hypothetical protein
MALERLTLQASAFGQLLLSMAYLAAPDAMDTLTEQRGP